MPDNNAQGESPTESLKLPRPFRNPHALLGSAGSELKLISFLSHDLRNNLNAISLQLAALGNRLQGEPDFAQEREEIACAVRSIAHTTEGMRQLLTYAKLKDERPEWTQKEVHLDELIRSVATCYLALAESKELTIVADVPPGAVLRSSYELITIVLQNLLGNAIKFSARGCVRIGAFRNTLGNQWRLVVSDEGPGIAPVELQHMFAAFARGDPLNHNGMGLGLYIAVEAAELIGGMISVESHPVVGSTFSLILPSNLEISP